MRYATSAVAIIVDAARSGFVIGVYAEDRSYINTDPPNGGLEMALRQKGLQPKFCRLFPDWDACQDWLMSIDAIARPLHVILRGE